MYIDLQFEIFILISCIFITLIFKSLFNQPCNKRTKYRHENDISTTCIHLNYMCTKIPISCLIDVGINNKSHKHNVTTTFIYHDNMYLHNFRITNTYFNN